VARPLRQEHLRIQATCRDERCGLFDPRASNLDAATGTGDRIDDDRNRSWHGGQAYYSASPRIAGIGGVDDWRSRSARRVMGY
jgi:hypothetical protein